MATIKKLQTYYCLDDCRQEGCPSHEATLEFQTVSNHYSFDVGGQKFHLDGREMQVVIDMLKSIDRADSVEF